MSRNCNHHPSNIFVGISQHLEHCGCESFWFLGQGCLCMLCCLQSMFYNFWSRAQCQVQGIPDPYVVTKHELLWIGVSLLAARTFQYILTTHSIPLPGNQWVDNLVTHSVCSHIRARFPTARMPDLTVLEILIHKELNILSMLPEWSQLSQNQHRLVHWWLLIDH